MRLQMFNSFALILFIAYLKVCFTRWNSIADRVKIEEHYESHVLSKKANLYHPNSICNFTEVEKATICQILFKKQPQKAFGISLNKTAFHFLTLKCEPKILTFLYRTHFNSAKIQQMMFPCYGRHDPMQTNYAVDNFFDMFYVSGDFVRNILFVYKVIKKVENNIMKIYRVYTNVKYYEAMTWPAFISKADVQNELQSLQIMSHDKHERSIETIYLREMMYNIFIPNPICNLKKIEKILLCNRILENNLYKNKYYVLNTAAFLAYEPQCQENNLAFIRLVEYNKSNIKQLMMPCFGKDATRDDNVPWQEDKFLKHFSISAGPVANSVFVYYQLAGADSNLYHVYELIQNVHLEISDHAENESQAIEELLTKIERDNSRFKMQPGLPPHVFFETDYVDEKEEEDEEDDEPKGEKGTEEEREGEEEREDEEEKEETREEEDEPEGEEGTEEEREGEEERKDKEETEEKREDEKEKDGREGEEGTEEEREGKKERKDEEETEEKREDKKEKDGREGEGEKEGKREGKEEKDEEEKEEKREDKKEKDGREGGEEKREGEEEKEEKRKGKEEKGEGEEEKTIREKSL